MKFFDNNDDRELSECALNEVRNVILLTFPMFENREF